MKTKLIIGGIVGALLLVLGGTWWTNSMQSDDPDVLSKNGLHWHPQLAIFVKGEKVAIPQNIGIGPQYAGMPTFDSGMQMTAMHTHEDMPVIHLEFPGIVREKDIVLGNFFRIWGKDMRSFGTNMRMTVNGEVNTEFENYIMGDGDKIELRYD
jgi:hypothetical protein